MQNSDTDFKIDKKQTKWERKKNKTNSHSLQKKREKEKKPGNNTK